MLEVPGIRVIGRSRELRESARNDLADQGQLGVAQDDFVPSIQIEPERPRGVVG